MKIQKIIMLLMMLLLVSCTNYDHLASFIVSGRVIDQATKLPINDVKIDFVDTGFDYVHSKEHFAKSVGATNNEGCLEAKFNYFWGDQGILWIKPSSKQTFDISIARTGYQRKVISFKSKELERQSGGWKVNLGDIELVAEK